jgi:cyclopropane-fatty-acyl-phospholipid synthase
MKIAKAHQTQPPHWRDNSGSARQDKNRTGAKKEWTQTVIDRSKKIAHNRSERWSSLSKQLPPEQMTPARRSCGLLSVLRVFSFPRVLLQAKNRLSRSCAVSMEWSISMSALKSDDRTELITRRSPSANRIEDDGYCPANAAEVPWSISFSNGFEEFFGSGHPAFTIMAPDRPLWRAILGKSTYSAAMAFVKGQIEIEGDLVAAVRWWAARRNRGFADWVATALSRFALLRLERLFQSRRRADRSIQSNCDRLFEFYKCFLDENLVYSCGYFRQPSDSLDRAQISKMEHICRKLELKPGNRFLDIGCGWGALLMHAAKHHGVNSTGCTLNDHQFEFAQGRAIREGRAATVRISQSDYRNVVGKFEKIASVGMFEYVGRSALPSYFARVSELLETDGLFLNQGIILPQKVNVGPETAFLHRHVFPSGELSCLSDVVLAAENAGFEILDLESLRPHYALTCRQWLSRLRLSGSNAIKLAGPEVYRAWMLYLAASSASFEAGHTDVYQFLMSKRGSGRRRHLTRIHMSGQEHEER